METNYSVGKRCFMDFSNLWLSRLQQSRGVTNADLHTSKLAFTCKRDSGAWTYHQPVHVHVEPECLENAERQIVFEELMPPRGMHRSSSRGTYQLDAR